MRGIPIHPGGWDLILQRRKKRENSRSSPDTGGSRVFLKVLSLHRGTDLGNVFIQLNKSTKDQAQALSPWLSLMISSITNSGFWLSQWVLFNTDLLQRELVPSRTLPITLLDLRDRNQSLPLFYLQLCQTPRLLQLTKSTARDADCPVTKHQGLGRKTHTCAAYEPHAFKS